MGFDITRQSLIRTILLFLFMYAIFGVREYLFTVPVQFDLTDFSFLGRSIYDFSVSRPYLNEILTFIFLFVNAFYLTRLATRNLILVDRSYLPAIIYIVICAGYTVPAQNIISLLAAFFIIAAVENIINSYKRLDRFNYFFNAGMCIGIAVLIYPQTVPYVILLPISLIYFTRTWRDWFLSLVGLSVPLFLLSYITWATGPEFGFIYRAIFAVLEDGAGDIIKNISVAGYIMSTFYLLLAVFGIIVFMGGKARTKKRAVRLFILFVWMLILTIPVLSLEENPTLAIPLAAVPLSIMIPAFFNRKKGIIGNILYIAIIIVTIVFNLIPILLE